MKRTIVIGKGLSEELQTQNGTLLFLYCIFITRLALYCLYKMSFFIYVQKAALNF